MAEEPQGRKIAFLMANEEAGDLPAFDAEIEDLAEGTHAGRTG